MIDVNALKVGVTFVDGGAPFKVMKYDFTKMGRGNATIKVKAKNLFTGAIVTKGFISGNRVEDITLVKKHLQYLYKDEKYLFLMDPISFEQVEIPVEVCGPDVEYLVEGEKAWVLYWEDRVLGVEIPASVVLKVVEAEPGVKGNSVGNVMKNAILESGKKIMVPLFVQVGELVKVNTEEGTYIGRVNEG